MSTPEGSLYSSNGGGSSALPTSITSIVNGLQAYFVSPVGIQGGGSTILNGGAHFGPDTTLGSSAPNVTGAPYTQTCGVQEALNMFAGTLYSAANFKVSLLPGNFACSAAINFPAKYCVLQGAGSGASSIQSNFTPATTAAAWSSTTAYVPGNLVTVSSQIYQCTAANTNETPPNNNYWVPGPVFVSWNGSTPGNGSYIGEVNFDAHGKAWPWFVCPGYPGGQSPDQCAAQCWMNDVSFSSTGSVINFGLVMSGIEDAHLMNMHCGGNGCNVEWILNDGAGKMTGGNYTDITLSDHHTITAVVFVQLTIAATQTNAGSRITLLGGGFNGVAGSPLIIQDATHPVTIVSAGMNWTMNSGAAAGSGMVGGTAGSNLTFISLGDNFSFGGTTATTNGLFGSTVAGAYAVMYGTYIGETIAQLVANGGAGNSINGYVYDSTYTMFNLRVNASVPMGYPAATVFAQRTSDAPSTVATSSAPVQVGLGTGSYTSVAPVITPAMSGTVRVTFRCLFNTATAAASIGIRGTYGTGSAPTNGTAQTGTFFGSLMSPVKNSGIAVANVIIYDAVITGLTVGTAYWFDLEYFTSNASDAAQLTNVDIIIQELMN
jgi:hypothetical protein